MRHGNVLHVDGADPFAARLDDILAAIGDPHIAIGVDSGHIARGEPAPTKGTAALTFEMSR